MGISLHERHISKSFLKFLERETEESLAYNAYSKTRDNKTHLAISFNLLCGKNPISLSETLSYSGRTSTRRMVRNRLLVSQNGECAFCRSSLDESKALLEHNHVTSLIRGVVCNSCNQRLCRNENPVLSKTFGKLQRLYVQYFVKYVRLAEPHVILVWTPSFREEENAAFKQKFKRYQYLAFLA